MLPAVTLFPARPPVSNFTVAILVALVVLAIFWVSLQVIWKWIPRRPERDAPGGGEVASGLAAILQETRTAIEAGALDAPRLLALVQRLRHLHERHIEAGGPSGVEGVVAEIRGNRTLCALIRGLSRAHLAQITKVSRALLSDPAVPEQDKRALRAIEAALPTLVA